MDALFITFVIVVFCAAMTALFITVVVEDKCGEIGPFGPCEVPWLMKQMRE